MSSATNVTSIIRRARTVFVAQLVLPALAVAAARLALAGRASMVLTLAIVVLNGSLVAWFLMGVRSERPWVVLTLVLVVVFCGSLLFWPGWDLHVTVRR